MKATILYDNTVWDTDMQADWGFACLIEAYGRSILFDTGADGTILLNNMALAGIHPTEIDEVFISHAHFDHVGGLSAFLHENPQVRVYVPPSVRGIHNAREVISIDRPIQLREQVFSTGELEHIEQAMVITTEQGAVVIVGCSHPGVKTILETASQVAQPFALLGGLHGFAEFDLLADLEVVCPAHCTRYKEQIKSRYPQKYVEAGVGAVIHLGS